MKKTWLAAAMITMPLALAMPTPALALNDLTLEKYFSMMDGNKDGGVSKKEFIARMEKMFDQHAAKMKGDSKMMKGEMMTKAGFGRFLEVEGMWVK